MNYLLDTCALIDVVFSPDRLSTKARAIIESDNDLCVSIASFWEIMIKQQIGKLGVRNTSAAVITSDRKFAQYGIDVIW